MKAFKSYFTPANEEASGTASRVASPRPPRPLSPESISSAQALSSAGQPEASSSSSPSKADQQVPPPITLPVLVCPSRASSPPASPSSPALVSERSYTSSSLTPEIADPPTPSSSRSPQNGDSSAQKHQQNCGKSSPSRSFTSSQFNQGGSRGSSLRHTLWPAGDKRNSSSAALLDIRTDMMVNWLYEQQLRGQLAQANDLFQGVVLKKERGSFVCCPTDMAFIPGSLFSVVSQMNVRCAMTVNTPAIESLMSNMQRQSPDITNVPLLNGLQVQVLYTVTDLPRGNLHHFAAFISDIRMMVVWDDEPEKLIQRARSLQQMFAENPWSNAYKVDGDLSPMETIAEEKGAGPAEGNVTEGTDPGQLEEALANEHRPIRFMSACVVGVTIAINTVTLGLGWRWLAVEVSVDNNYLRLALLVLAPIQFFVSMFFFQSVVGSIFQMFGPISGVGTNSKYYSGVAPRRLNRNVHTLPHVTFQMPVYKEGLTAVIKPTVVSIKAAISTYEMQGGTANIFVNDDGMQLIGDEEAQARRDFYDEHNIGWVARPAHCASPNTEKGERQFLRRGKFKKASNMNYALDVANRVEDKLALVYRGPLWTVDHELSAYYRVLEEVLHDDEGRTWAEGNIRVGDYVLIIDSDTRVPQDCLLDAVSEMEQSPEVAIIQFSSGVMNVTDSFFEKGVTWFTRLIYTSITFAVAAGDACPFVGHNAMLRWSAIQHAAAYEDEDGYEKYWSESHVSEDFDMALRLQVTGYTLRYATYTGDGFKEGVSLTVYDELARWEKYAYGCNELLFHPIRLWLVRGPFTPLFRRFLFSCIPFPKKVTIMAYIGTYYALSASWFLSISNYFITGWYYGLYDKFYLDSFAIYVSIVVVFAGLGNLSLAVLRYRMNEQSLVPSYLENLKWVPMFTIFLGGISIHVSQAILSHFFEIDMVWGATAKELDDLHFGQEMMRIVTKFKYTFLFCFSMAALMICGWYAFPEQWRITTFFSIYPLASVTFCHFALPVLLNPALMMFTW